MRLYTLLVLVCLFNVPSPAQHAAPSDLSSTADPLFITRRYTQREGLPYRIVSSIAQDPRGFLWLGTPQGLARFDGTAFLTLTSADGLASDAVRAVACDARGDLWVLHANGTLEMVDPVSLRITSLEQHVGPPPNEAVGPVTSLSPVGDGAVAYTQNGRVFWYSDRENGLRSLDVDCPGRVDLLSSAARGQVWCTCHLRPGDEWPVRLVRFHLGLHAGGGTPRETLRITNTLSVLCQRGHDLYARRPVEAAGTYLRMGESGGMRDRWVPIDGTTDLGNVVETRMATTPETDIFRVQLTDDLWLVNMRVRRMRAGDDPLAAPVVFDLTRMHPNALLGQLAVLRDRTGNVWIGGEFGLIQLSMQPDRFQRYLWNGSTETIGEQRIRGMLVRGNDLHVNTETSGYRVLDARTGATKYHDEATFFRTGIISDGQGGLWRSGRGEMLHERPDGRVDRRIKTASGNYETWTAALLENGSIMLGAIKGLRVAGVNDDAFNFTTTGNADLDQAWVAHISSTGQGTMLACTNAGLFELDMNGKVLQRWWTGAPKDTPQHFPTDDLRYAYTDSAGLYWIATGSQGLLRWDRERSHLRSIGRKEGLPLASIHAIIPDTRGLLWMPTDNGLVRYDPSGGEVKVYTTADGLGHNEFNRLAYAQGPDGRLYFGGLNGISSFHPDDLLQPMDLPTAPLVLESVKVQRDGNADLQEVTETIHRGSAIALHHADRFFTIDFALLSYEDPALIRYAWRIDGIDADWNIQREPHLRFTSLPYGDHVLRIKAKDAEGRWSPELRVPITMLRPLYLRWWFLLIAAVVAGAIVYAVVRYRERQLRHVIHMRDRIASDLHDEVGSNLSSIVLFSTAVARHADALPTNATGMLQRITNNSKRALESMNDIVWSVNSGNDQMGDLLDRMQAYAQPLCEAADIELDFDADSRSLARKLDMEQRKNIYLIFKEAMNNAVRHARCTHVDVRLRHVGDEVELVVADNGVGFSGNDPQKETLGGNGLGNMGRRAAQIGGTVQVSARPEGGTQVMFRSSTNE